MQPTNGYVANDDDYNDSTSAARPAPLKAAMALTMIVTTASTKPTPPVAQPYCHADGDGHPTHKCLFCLKISG